MRRKKKVLVVGSAEKSAGGVQIKEKSAGETAFERAKFF